MIDAGLYIMYILLIVAVIATIVFPVVNTIKTPGSAVKSLIALGGLVVVFGISYALSSSEVTPSQAALGVTESSAKLISAGLTMFYLTLILAFAGLAYSEINKALK